MLQQRLYGLQSLNYLLPGPLQKRSLLTSVLYHDLSSSYFHIYVGKILLSYVLSITTLSTKKEKGKGGRERGRMEALLVKIQQYVLEQVFCKGHVMYHTGG